MGVGAETLESVTVIPRSVRIIRLSLQRLSQPFAENRAAVDDKFDNPIYTYV